MGAGEAVLRGEMSAVRSAARSLSDLGGMQQAMHRLRTGIAQVQASGDSVALSRLRAACRPVERQAQQIAQVRQQAGRALASYAGRVDELQQRARRLRVRRGEAEARRVSLMNTLAAHSSTGPGMDALQAKMRSSLIGEETELGEIERQLAALDEERRAADARCASVLNGCASVLEGLPAGSSAAGFGALGQLPGVSFVARPNTSAGVRKLTAVLLRDGATPEEVAGAWAELIASEDFDADAFIQLHAARLGGLDGLPAMVRVAANRVRAPELLRQRRAELAQQFEGPYGGDKKVKFLLKEIAYLEQVRDGKVQLYLYDRDASRIVEMVGTINANTKRVVTFVPGTFANLEGFYDGNTQRITQWLVKNSPGTVAFVYKDGVFPGGATDPPWWNFPKGIAAEANDPKFGRLAGQQLAGFERGMRLDPTLGSRAQMGIGHSWGLANLTNSEVAGAHYDLVVSLAGAGMPKEWTPDPTTGYFDLSYLDILIGAQREGYVWKGNNPRTNPGFTALPLYTGPHDQLITEGNLPEMFSTLMENHNLVAGTNKDNQKVLSDLKTLSLGVNGIVE